MIDITGLREDKRPQSSTIVHPLLDRLEEAKKDNALKEKLIDRLALELNSTSLERDALRAKIAEMEQQEPVAKVESWTNGSCARHYKLKWLRDVGEGVALYALPGAKVEEPAPSIPEKLCYDSRWEVSIDYVDGWNAAVDTMRGKSPSWHCPDCCIAFPFGAPKSCPHDDTRCNKTLPGAKGEEK